MNPLPAPGWLSKRSKIVILAILQALVLAAVLTWLSQNLIGLPILLVSAYVIAIAMFEADLKREEWVVLPLYLVVASGIGFMWLRFYTGSGWAQWAGIAGFGLAIYFLMLTLNILNVATIRPLPLARTATTVFALTGMALAFSLFYFTLVYQVSALEWAGIVIMSSMVLAVPMLWTSLPPSGRLVRSLAWSAIVGGVMGELASVVGLWPVSFMTSLFLTGVLGVIVGILHHQEKRLLSRQMLHQYYLVGGILLIVLYLATNWA